MKTNLPIRAAEGGLGKLKFLPTRCGKGWLRGSHLHVTLLTTWPLMQVTVTRTSQSEVWIRPLQRTSALGVEPFCSQVADPFEKSLVEQNDATQANKVLTQLKTGYGVLKRLEFAKEMRLQANIPTLVLHSCCFCLNDFVRVATGVRVLQGPDMNFQLSSGPTANGKEVRSQNATRIGSVLSALPRSFVEIDASHFLVGIPTHRSRGVPTLSYNGFMPTWISWKLRIPTPKIEKVLFGLRTRVFPLSNGYFYS